VTGVLLVKKGTNRARPWIVKDGDTVMSTWPTLPEAHNAAHRLLAVYRSDISGPATRAILKASPSAWKEEG